MFLRSASMASNDILVRNRRSRWQEQASQLFILSPFPVRDVSRWISISVINHWCCLSICHLQHLFVMSCLLTSFHRHHRHHYVDHEDWGYCVPALAARLLVLLYFCHRERCHHHHHHHDHDHVHVQGPAAGLPVLLPVLQGRGGQSFKGTEPAGGGSFSSSPLFITLLLITLSLSLPSSSLWWLNRIGAEGKMSIMVILVTTLMALRPSLSSTFTPPKHYLPVSLSWKNKIWAFSKFLLTELPLIAWWSRKAKERSDKPDRVGRSSSCVAFGGNFDIATAYSLEPLLNIEFTKVALGDVFKIS